MDVWRLIATRKIDEAIAEGEFDNLEGRGRPLDLTENPFEDPSSRMAHRLLRNNGFAPAWIEEGRDLDRAIAGCPRSPELLAALNRRIRHYNLRLPRGVPHKPLL